MIGNTDWSTLFQHNQDVMALDDKTIVPMAYDFDMTGLVNPPYAQVSNLVYLESVKDRLYRGFCRDQQLMQQVRQEFLDKKTEILDEVAQQKIYYSEADAKMLISYLNGFFDILESDRLFENKILNACRQVDGTVMK
jgi:hypothetical protein